MLDNILKLQNKFDVFMFDMWGVVFNGCGLVTEVVQTMKELKKQGKQVIIISNASRRVYVLEQEKEDKGLLKGVHYDSIVSSGELANQYFSTDTRKMKYYTIGKDKPKLFEGSPYEQVNNIKDADFVFLGTPMDKSDNYQTTIDIFKPELDEAHKLDKSVICANPDLQAQEKEGMMIMEGSLAKYYKELGGEVEYIGKPYPEIFDFALKDYQGDDSRVLMIGDTLETDILGANAYGIKSALIIEGGVSYDNMLKEGLTDIKEYAEALDIYPNYYL